MTHQPPPSGSTVSMIPPPFFFTIIGIYLLYSVVLVSVVQHSESAVCIHISSLFSWISFPFRSPQ